MSDRPEEEWIRKLVREEIAQWASAAPLFDGVPESSSQMRAAFQRWALDYFKLDEPEWERAAIWWTTPDSPTIIFHALGRDRTNLTPEWTAWKAAASAAEDSALAALRETALRLADEIDKMWAYAVGGEFSELTQTAELRKAARGES